VPVALPSLRASRADAIWFLLDAYEHAAVRPGKGLPHAQSVADVLREAGADETAQLAGLLHDVVEDTPRTVDDVRARFGDAIANIVDALTEDPSVQRYAQRKRMLRSRVAAAGFPAVDIALADKVASLRYALITGDEVSRRKLAHYRASLHVGVAAGASPALVEQLEEALAAHRGAAQPGSVSFALDPTRYRAGT
jgi:(p)ppGpp synthase/HD superfamily hydrolase